MPAPKETDDEAERVEQSQDARHHDGHDRLEIQEDVRADVVHHPVDAASNGHLGRLGQRAQAFAQYARTNERGE